MKKVLALLFFFASCYSLAVVDAFEFENQQQRERYHKLIEELRCPKCQNQSLSGSDSQIAEDLRKRLYQMIIDGKSDQQIKDHMVERYGNFVLYQPPVDKNTIWLWLLPSVLLALAAFVVLFLVLAKKTGKGKTPELNGLTAAEQQSLQELLDRHKHE